MGWGEVEVPLENVKENNVLLLRNIDSLCHKLLSSLLLYELSNLLLLSTQLCTKVILLILPDYSHFTLGCYK